MNVKLCQHESEGKRWQEFVDRHIQSTHCHRWNWKQVIENSFGWPTYYLMAEDGSEVRGVLPVVWQKSWIPPAFKKGSDERKLPKSQLLCQTMGRTPRISESSSAIK